MLGHAAARGSCILLRVLPVCFFTEAVRQQQAGCVGTLQRARLAFKRWWVLLLLRLGGVQVDCLWTEARYEKALLVAGFTQIEVSMIERALAASPPSRLIHVHPLVCLHRAAGAPPSCAPHMFCCLHLSHKQVFPGLARYVDALSRGATAETFLRLLPLRCVAVVFASHHHHILNLLIEGLLCGCCELRAASGVRAALCCTMHW